MTNETTVEHTPPPAPSIDFTLPDGHHLVSPVVLRPTYAIGYESWGQHVFMHLRFAPDFSGDDGDALSRDVTTLLGLLGRPLQAVCIPNDTGFSRILEELGFTLADKATNHKGDEVDVFTRAPADNNPAQASAH